MKRLTLIAVSLAVLLAGCSRLSVEVDDLPAQKLRLDPVRSSTWTTHAYHYVYFFVKERALSAVFNKRGPTVLDRVVGEMFLRIPGRGARQEYTCPDQAQGYLFAGTGWGRLKPWRFSGGSATAEFLGPGLAVAAEVKLSAESGEGNGTLSLREVIVDVRDRGVPARLFAPSNMAAVPDLKTWLAQDPELGMIVGPLDRAGDERPAAGH